MRPVDDTLFVAASAPLAEAAERLSTNGVGHAAVLDSEGLVVGSIGREDLDVSPRSPRRASASG
jgi:CBS domain-containing protein